jgi:hypothetical protein
MAAEQLGENPAVACPCENPAARYTQFEERSVPGCDKTNGRFGEVTIERCRDCQRFWLKYQVEYQSFSRSGRWGRGLIDEAMIEQITPENALDYLHGLAWYILGGSYWGKAERVSGPSHWDL